ncbi:MAG: hypothetical protein A3I44_00095 [Candidatus Sungbacteria bacterium RIFCSPLOWO2_02_FULL_51_17]|uniref:Uncharacterized protein n=1 Tax=Candidatus Sungbacteria bacterium RIFCSPHIGHO2_02_FULL_51_29 TaxID=1802273 RepID=A0A1G2KTR2_9BACT|nr:MAG: hypothetical protein A2676_05530 [Candidatus Sungbacteria bacterium RIFCSPHIGHO2_01_FULL_51_22]OHA01779.1 MAG: hypothetical protein A3C16_02735 [Candidatus Sungbacteria bacterium RIFCSPHIGHO2_02_FULL_51_29]OHA07973.1 MAG: hypothetical protein A3B29_04225 [Candidatus Sungbacteria bacterium RIFCSPLOWO2_01_FULL_51_34]OHA11557.1 MAG: hypothetical protein A3I44_00095 [Candidatus Sungbacteria bacterium RIFCSPLOWO2_02_FULL_51_17]
MARDRKKRIQRTELDNGMVILSRYMPSRTVAFGIGLRHHAIYDRIEKKPVIAADGTSAEETIDREGELHVLEHLLLKGTPGHNFEQCALALEKRGTFSAHTRRFGILSWAHIANPNYPHNNFEPAFKMLMRLAAKPTFPAREFDYEKEVVILEIHRDQEPLVIGMDTVYEELYRGSPLARSVIGKEKTVQNLQRADFDDLYRAIFIPQNVVVLSYGAIPHERFVAAAKDFFSRRFGNAPAEDPLKAWKEEVHERMRSARPVLGVRKEKVVPGIGASSISFGWNVPSSASPEFYALLLLEYILGPSESNSGILSLEIREKHRTTYRVDTVEYDYSPHHGCFFVSSLTDVNLLLQFEEIMVGVCQRLWSEGVGRERFEAAREKAISSFELLMEDKKEFLDRMFLAELFGSSEELDNFVRRISAVKRRDVNDVLKRYFNPDHMVRVVVRPEPEPAKSAETVVPGV